MGGCTPISTLFLPGLTFSYDDYPTNTQDMNEIKDILYHEVLGLLI